MLGAELQGDLIPGVSRLQHDALCHPLVKEHLRNLKDRSPSSFSRTQLAKGYCPASIMAAALVLLVGTPRDRSRSTSSHSVMVGMYMQSLLPKF